MEKVIKNKLRTLAFYLPQFHAVDINDKWYGLGYTEWTAVKNAKSLYPGHYQPDEPLNDNYYDLLKKDTMVWQANLAKQYGVSGFCFYHYYFKDGRKVLEKPAENLLQWQDIDMPFCFDWANESWARKWGKFKPGVSVNVWNKVVDLDAVQGPKEEIILEQAYGEADDWQKHFAYLLPFFQDKRYIKKDGKPVFIFHRPEEIPCLQEMTDLWNDLAKQAGLPGVFFIGTMLNPYTPCPVCLDARILHFHHTAQYFVTDRSQQGGLPSDDYGLLCDAAVAYNTDLADGRPSFYCIGTGFDNTPRWGTKGYVITDPSAKKFCSTLKKMMGISNDRGLEFLFLNAWNEWGEGMHLEPSKKDGFAYLEAVKEATDENNIHALVPEQLSEHEQYCHKLLTDFGSALQGQRDLAEIMSVWLHMLCRGHSIGKYLLQHDCHNVAIYGYGNMGHHLAADLEGSGIGLNYVIDRRGTDGVWDAPCQVYGIDADLPKTDAVIVSVLNGWKELENSLHERGIVKTFSLVEILMEFKGKIA